MSHESTSQATSCFYEPKLSNTPDVRMQSSLNIQEYKDLS